MVTTSPDPVRELASFPGDASHYRVCFSIDEYIYVGMGIWYDQAGTRISSDFYRYSTDTDVWSKVSSFPGKPRSFATGFAISGKGYVGLGIGAGDHLNDFWAYDPVIDSWQQVSNFPGEERQDATSFVINDEGYVGLGVGYEASDGEKFLDDFWKFDPSTETWSQISSFGGEPRVRAFVFSINEKGFVGKGELENIGETDDLWEYDSNEDQWVEKANPSLTNEDGIGFGLKNKGYVVFGGDLNFLHIYQYNIEIDEWVLIKTEHFFCNLLDVGLSAQGKVYMIDTENKFY